MATDAEYGEALRTRITPLMTGVGPVEAALQLSRCLSERDRQPDIVVSLGSAGSNSLTKGCIYQASSVSYRDMNATAFGFPKGQTPFLDVPPVIVLAPQVEGLDRASLSTGANVVSGNAYDAIDADMVDMESYAVVRVGMEFGIPVVILRGISDGDAPVNALKDWTALLAHIDRELATAYDLVLDQLADGSLLSSIA